jgi:hypothetical protein
MQATALLFKSLQAVGSLGILSRVLVFEKMYVELVLVKISTGEVTVANNQNITYLLCRSCTTKKPKSNCKSTWSQTMTIKFSVTIPITNHRETELHYHQSINMARQQSDLYIPTSQSHSKENQVQTSPFPYCLQ